MPGIGGVIGTNGSEPIVERLVAGRDADRWSEAPRGIHLYRTRRDGAPPEPWGVRNGDATTFSYGPRDAGFFAAVEVAPDAVVVRADRFASLPIFYAIIPGGLVFGPDVRSVIAHPAVGRDVDPAALATFLACGHLTGDQTLLKSVRRLRGGHLLTVRGGDIEPSVYWRFRPGADATGAATDQLEADLADLVVAAAGRNLSGGGRPVVLLSGGADSRGILGGCIASLGDPRRIDAATWGTGEDVPRTDAAVATAIAQSLGLKHRIIRRGFGDDFVNAFQTAARLADCLSDIAADHPDEHRMMRQVRDAGFDRILRGDEVFGWTFHAADHDAAAAVVFLRRLRDGPSVSRVVRAEHRRDLLEASDAVVDDLIASVRHLTPDQARDTLYFNHRLQCYLNPSSYHRQAVVEQRNVLLDNDILDFMARVPDSGRVDKTLYRRAMARRFPDLWRFPFSLKQSHLDWAGLIGGDTPVRAYAAAHFDDARGGVWEYVDRDAMKQTLAACAGRRAPSSLKTRLRLAAKTAFKSLPLVSGAVLTRRAAQREYAISPEMVIRRVLLLKQFYDEYVAPDSARAERPSVSASSS